MNNTIIGNPNVIDSNIEFNGNNNILFCEEGVTISNSTIKFQVNNSLIYLSKNINPYKINVSINDNSVLFIGTNTKMADTINIRIAESTNIIIGSDCLLSFGLWIRTSDPHLMYDIKTLKRINMSKSILIGDHTWIGQNVLILKGTKISSGSIIGANSLLSNKYIKSNESWGGNPAKLIKRDILWDPISVHRYQEEDTLKSLDYNNLNDNPNKYIYNDINPINSFKEIDKLIKSMTVDDKLKYYQELSNDKYRFVIKGE